ncbi:hypothetical protein L4D77_21055 [Photobacterium frigidiphilum]|uniref:hypothetical protein n=1 Tax=Photobacterium frigidiphilum TaxID=264736 RepID=UPI003D147D14
MRPASPVRYVRNTPRSPSRLRSTAHAPTFKPKNVPQSTADIHVIPTSQPVLTNPVTDEQAA